MPSRDVEEAVYRSLGIALLDAPVLMTTGVSNLAYRIRTDNGLFIFKRETVPGRFDNSVAVARRLESVRLHGKPIVPRVLAHVRADSPFSIRGAGYVIEDLVPGNDGKTLLASHNEVGRRNFYERFGELLNTAHGQRLQTFGNGLKDSDLRFASWAETIDAILRARDKWWSDHRNGRNQQWQEMRVLIERLAARVDHLVVASVCHNDPNPGNTVGEYGPDQLIDFEFAKAWDPLTDLQKVLRDFERYDPHGWAHFVAGYFSSFNIPEDIMFDERIALAAGVKAAFVMPDLVARNHKVAQYDEQVIPQFVGDCRKLLRLPKRAAIGEPAIQAPARGDSPPTVYVFWDFDGTASQISTTRAVVLAAGGDPDQYKARRREWVTAQKKNFIDVSERRLSTLFLSYAMRTGLLRPLSIADIRHVGQTMPLYPQWAELVRFAVATTEAQYAHHGLRVHNTISSCGLGQPIEGALAAAGLSMDVRANRFSESQMPDGIVVIDDLIEEMSDIKKTDVIWEVTKLNVGKVVPRSRSLATAIYIGNGRSDENSWGAVTRHGGKTIAVHDTSRPEKFAWLLTLQNAGTVNDIAEADYRPDSRVAHLLLGSLNAAANVAVQQLEQTQRIQGAW